jgi:flagellar biosynthetic protein FliR
VDEGLDPLVVVLASALGIGDTAADWARFLLVLARVTPLALIAPWVLVPRSPIVVRAAVAVGLAVAFAPNESPPVDWGLVLLAGRELLVGLAFAVATSAALYAARWGGALTDLWRGAPWVPAERAPTAELYTLFSIVLLVGSGAHHAALASFADGFVAVPLELRAIDSAALLEGALRLLGDVLAFAASIAAPAGAAVFLVDATFAVVARATPSASIAFAALPLRAAIGIVAVLLVLGLLADEVTNAFAETLSIAGDWIARAFSP